MKTDRIQYPSGVWSERQEAKLHWGKGDKTQTAAFGPDDKIEDVPSGYHAAIRQAGHSPDQFCSVGSTIAARILIPEIEQCIATARARKEAEAAKARVEFETDKASGKAFRVVEIASQYGAELTWAQHNDKQGIAANYADWVLFGYAGAPRLKIEEEAASEIIKDRKAAGAFPGCNNSVWAITETEWEQIAMRSKEITARKAEARKNSEAAEAADILRKKETGYCFSCGTWCHGACGHYSNNPETKFARDYNQAFKEQNYGITEGE